MTHMFTANGYQALPFAKSVGMPAQYEYPCTECDFKARTKCAWWRHLKHAHQIQHPAHMYAS
eukprot:12427365-Karenia_brevis.AAC.1